MARLGREFYARGATALAPDLLGKVLVRAEPGAVLRARLVEVEAYAGASDPGSHAYRGETARNRTMFGPAGRLYVYFTYGMHWCANVVGGDEGEAQAVLLRAAEPLDGIEVMQERRKRTALRDLCSGPAKLCQAFGITGVTDGADLVSGEIWIEDDGFTVEAPAESTRVGLTAGAEFPWRYFVAGSPFVSPGRPSLPSTPPRE